MLARPVIFFNENRKQAAEKPEIVTSGSRAGWKRFWAITRGVLIAIPIIAIFAALLSSADLVFAQRLQGFIKLFRLENLPQYIFRVHLHFDRSICAGGYDPARRPEEQG